MPTSRQLALSAAASIAALALAAACAGGGEPSEDDRMCAAMLVQADKSTHAPRPDETAATFWFPGNRPEQREYFFVHEDGSYDYVERWDVGIPHDLEHEREVGWDWKVGCRMHVCPLPEGGACCHQICRDGGDSGVAYEPPDAFACMNASAGGEFDWFVEGLRDNGMDALDACVAPRSDRSSR
jgi:hypothetical protein